MLLRELISMMGFMKLKPFVGKGFARYSIFLLLWSSGFFVYSLAFSPLDCENDGFMNACTFTDFGDCCFAMGMIDSKNRVSFST